MEQFQILKKGQKTAVFVGDAATVQTCFQALHDCFFFVCGTAAARTDEFPYSVHPV